MDEQDACSSIPDSKRLCIDQNRAHCVNDAIKINRNASAYKQMMEKPKAIYQLPFR
jgi:hypothetical protein